MVISAAPPLEVRASRLHGLGVFATRRIRAGARIIEYAGERVTETEASARYNDDAMDHHHTFLFEVGGGTIIDAAHEGNEARFINHSCDPNCDSYIERGHVYIEAIKNIQPGVELCYDYALWRPGPARAAWSRLYACRCGATNCRGTMLKTPPRKRRRHRKCTDGARLRVRRHNMGRKDKGTKNIKKPKKDKASKGAAKR